MSADDTTLSSSRGNPRHPEDEIIEAVGAEAIVAPTFDLHSIFRGFGACLISMIAHLAGLLALALLMVEPIVKSELQTLVASVLQERPEDEPVEIELNQEIQAATDQTLALMSSAPAMGFAGSLTAMGTPTLDQELVEQAEASEIAIERPTLGMPSSEKLIEAVPDGEVKGDPRAIVGDYKEALDRITQEIMWMLDKGPVLVIWCFDQSGSMKDDQREIRNRVDHVYNQLGILGRDNSDALLTSVTSYGEGFQIHTSQPTSDRVAISQAIDAVPVDETGKELMCQAVGRAIASHRSHTRRNRQMVMILVTDETGDRENNTRYLEAAITEAKSARCRIYVLGREAVFGYPYAFIRWRHPQTERVHWLRIDRGPETAFPEQLQTNGFRRRHDAFSSGFGPYEQTRMARETNGVFFMLPSVETNLVSAQKHRYGLEAMRPYRPDLRSREETFADRDRYPLRTLIWKVISDLNPYNKATSKAVELRVDYSTNLEEFVRQARRNQQKALLHLQYMAEAEKALADGASLREQEVDPRWQANYDLIIAQIVAYQARTYEYGVALDDFMKNPKIVPPTKSPDLRLEDWDIATTKKTRTEESKPYIERANTLFKAVQEKHPGSPWAARAQWELRRGYGVNVVPDYERPPKIVPNPSPIPKL
ncbi:MAG: vWA domain-containing protein [Pirellulaceae bacterium]